MSFKRNIENLVCENCGFSVQGDGYTNHCPNCLWGKHVDVEPGDRKEKCQGMMKPINVLKNHGKYILLHECARCGARKNNKMQKDDNFDALVNLLREK